MRTFLLADRLNQLHWSMLKIVLMIIALLPLSQALHFLWLQADLSSQIIFGFLGLSVFTASCLIVFIFALQATTWTTDLIRNRQQQRLFELYRQLPMLFFSAYLVFILLQF